MTGGFWAAGSWPNVMLLTAELAGVTTLILVVFGLPIAWFLARGRGPMSAILSALVSLPLVLPPTVLGFYLLVAFAPDGPLSAALARVGIGPLAFTFPGLVAGSVLYSLPFAIQPMRDAFQAIGARPLEVAATLGAGPIDRFLSVAVPMARSGIVTAGLLSFAHTVGEFGVVLMIGGNIPGQTRTLSIALFDAVEASDWPSAHRVALGLVAFSFVLVLVLDRGRHRSGS